MSKLPGLIIIPGQGWILLFEDKALSSAFLLGGVGEFVGWIVGSIAKEKIVIGESQFGFEKNVQLLSKYSLLDAGL